jgi:hypothetical protein
MLPAEMNIGDRRKSAWSILAVDTGVNLEASCLLGQSDAT